MYKMIILSTSWRFNKTTNFFNLKPHTKMCAYVTQISVLDDLGGRDLDEVMPNVVAFLVAFVGRSWRLRSVCVGNLGKSHLGN
jgi:hypothetical protein